MNNEIYEILLKLPKKNIINLMWEALDHMQAYNCRSRTYCILESMGYKQVEDKKWRPCSLAEIKKNTDNMGL